MHTPIIRMNNNSTIYVSSKAATQNLTFVRVKKQDILSSLKDLLDLSGSC